MEVFSEEAWLFCFLHRIGQMESSSSTTVGPAKVVEGKVCSTCLHQWIYFFSSSMADHVMAVRVKVCLAYHPQTLPASFSAMVDLVLARDKACLIYHRYHSEFSSSTMAGLVWATLVYCFSCYFAFLAAVVEFL